MGVKKIKFYEGSYYCFSNWSAHAVKYNNTLYPTSEHAYHCQRFKDPKIVKSILKSKSPYLAKLIVQANKDKQLSDWNSIKRAIMKDILREKLKQHKEIREVLLKTGQKEIVENSREDYFWGVGKDGTGKNELGKIWIELRKEFIEEKIQKEN